MSKKSDEKALAEASGRAAAKGGVSKRAKWAVGLLVLALYGAGLNAQWRFSRDSAIYMGVARSMVEGRGYTFNYEPHTKYMPGFPTMLAATGQVFGIPDTLSDSFLAYNVLVSLLGLGSIVLFYFILRELDLSGKVFAVAFLFFAFSKNLHYHSCQILTDTPFTFFGMAALLFGLVASSSRRGWKPWAALGATGLMLGAACVIRPVGPLLIAAVIAGLCFSPRSKRAWKSRLLQTASLLALIVVLYAVYSQYLRPQGAEGTIDTYTQGAIQASRIVRFFQNLLILVPDHFGGLSDCVLGTDAGWPVGFILAAIMIVGLIGSLRRGERQLSVFTLLLMGVIMWGGWHFHNRYLLPASFVLFYWLALGGNDIGNWLRERGGFWTAERTRRLGGICVGLVIAVNLVRIGDVIVEQRGDFYSETGRGRLEDYRPVLKWLRDNADEDALVCAYESTTIHYFTRLRTRYLPRHRGRLNVEEIGKRLAGANFVVSDGRYPTMAEALGTFRKGNGLGLEKVTESGKVTLFRVVGK